MRAFAIVSLHLNGDRGQVLYFACRNWDRRRNWTWQSPRLSEQDCPARKGEGKKQDLTPSTLDRMIGSIGSISRRTRLNSQHCGLVSSAGLHSEVNVGRRKPRAASTWNSRCDPADAHEPRQKSRMSPFPSTTVSLAFRTQAVLVRSDLLPDPMFAICQFLNCECISLSPLMRRSIILIALSQ